METIATRVGELIIIEYLSDEQAKLLHSANLSDQQLKLRRDLEYTRRDAFAEVRRQYGRILRGEELTAFDPLHLEFEKMRNGNSLNQVYLGM